LILLIEMLYAKHNIRVTKRKKMSIIEMTPRLVTGTGRFVDTIPIDF